MPNGLSPLEEYAAALTFERAAWDAVRASLPGSSGFNQELWQRWRQAVDAADQAAERAKAAATPPQVRRRGWGRLVASFRACEARPSPLA
jgi:hypothetical protein